MLDQDALIPSILEPDELSKESGRNWARLIQKHRLFHTSAPCFDKWIYFDREYPEVYPPVEGHTA